VIEINLLVPYEDKPVINAKAGDNFVIIQSAKNRQQTRRYFLIQTTEEEYMFLRLKYGSENVWLR
jgi:hypothetical protein